MSLTLNSVPGKLLIFTLFNSFPEVFFILSFDSYALSSHSF